MQGSAVRRRQGRCASTEHWLLAGLATLRSFAPSFPSLSSRFSERGCWSSMPCWLVSDRRISTYGWLGCGQVVKCRPFLFADIQSPVSGWLGDVTGQSIKQALITWSKGGRKVRTHLPYDYTHSRHLPPTILAIHSEKRYSDILIILTIHPVEPHTHALTTYPSGHPTPCHTSSKLP